MAVSTKVKEKKARPIEIGEGLRKAGKWFEEGSSKAKDAALKKKMVEWAVKGSVLDPGELIKLVDELEEIQRQLIPLQLRHKKISGKLLPHWGHTGIAKLKGKLGETIFPVSYTISVSPDVLKAGLTAEQWRAVTELRVNPQLLFGLAEKNEAVRSLILKAVRASAQVKIFPPSSRTLKSSKKKDKKKK